MRETRTERIRRQERNHQNWNDHQDEIRNGRIEVPKPANDNFVIEIRPATREDIVVQQKHANDNHRKKFEKSG